MGRWHELLSFGLVSSCEVQNPEKLLGVTRLKVEKGALRGRGNEIQQTVEVV